MGNLILCSGKKAEHPYHFEKTDTNIYSIEELCFYIYTNIYIIGDELSQDSLIDWLNNEIDMPVIGNKLKDLVQRDYSLKDIVVSILCCADYYTEKEIKDIIKVMDEIALLSPIRRMKMKADKYIIYHNYKEAIRLYQEISRNKDAAVFTEEEYGNILHNLAIAYLYTSSYHEAAEYFISAYQRNKNVESLKQYMYTLLLSDQKEAINKAIEDYSISEELIRDIYQQELVAKEKVVDSSSYKEIASLKELKASSKVSEYYQKINNLLKELKLEYRK
jgi:tetratricopeptide (TPR) repeat protein